MSVLFDHFSTITFLLSTLQTEVGAIIKMVNFSSIVSGVLAVSSFTSFTVAHPGEKHDMDHVKRQIEARIMRAAAAKCPLANCQSGLKHRQLMERSVLRRSQALGQLREKRGINASKS